MHKFLIFSRHYRFICKNTVLPVDQIQFYLYLLTHRRQGAIDKQDVRSLTDSAEKAQTKDSMFWDW
ncbi:hypothetical protein M2263_002341 [Providencia alcalifaciens]|nr:hypothetical protein [Providencia alcalifaciens]